MSVDVIEVSRPVSIDVIEIQPMTRSGSTPGSETESAGTITVGSRICVTSYCPFRGLRGTVLEVHLLEASPDDESLDDPCGVCLVRLDGVPFEPLELLLDDVDLFTPVAIR